MRFLNHSPGRWLCAAAILCALHACGDGSDGTEADELGVGAQCASDDECAEEQQRCLQQFKGGYCGIQDCAADTDCPTGSACVTHSDGINYCFRVCDNKGDCNVNRDADNESNCSSNVIFVEGSDNFKACVPPSGA